MTASTRVDEPSKDRQDRGVVSIRKRPVAPADISQAAADLWNDIALSLPADFFQPGDLPLLQAYCTASDRKNQVDAAILKEGIIHNGAANPGLRISRDEAALMASLAVKLRLCQSSRTRPESASLKAAHTGQRPWDPIDPAAEFFT